MAYFIYQAALMSTVAVIAGTLIGWWLHRYYGQEQLTTSESDLDLVKNYLAESIKENARLKLQLEQTEEKVDVLVNQDAHHIEGVDFEAYQAFENTVKEATMCKYLN